MKKTAIIFFFAAVMAAGSAFSQEIVTVTASGSASVASGNVDSARQAAIDDAKRAAVEQVGSEVISETVVENFELVKDVVVTRISGYVKSYELTEDMCMQCSCDERIPEKSETGRMCGVYHQTD